MSAGLFGLLDDVAALARLAAASVDDVGAAAGRASTKAAGVVIDDTAVTPQYVRGLAANRELPIILRIAKGSLRNKLIFILPVALLLSQFLPWLLTPILMLGGAYLCYAAAEKILHAITARFGGHAHGAAHGEGHGGDLDGHDVAPSVPLLAYGEVCLHQDAEHSVVLGNGRRVAGRGQLLVGVGEVEPAYVRRAGELGSATRGKPHGSRDRGNRADCLPHGPPLG